MWTGRFSQPTADLVLKYGESVSYDWKLYEHDIAGSIAHARAQLRAGMLTEEEFGAIESGLQGILADIREGNFNWSIRLEDVHMNIESELTRFVVAATSVTQLIYMSEIGSIIMGSKIPVSLKDLFIIFVERTIVTLPVIALFAHLIF